MLLNAYSIFDRKGLVYHAPFYAGTDGSAVRSVADLVGDPNTTVSRHPADYVLFRVGVFDDASGALVPLSPIEHVVDCVSLVKQQPELFAQPVVQSPGMDVRANGHGS